MLNKIARQTKIRDFPLLYKKKITEEEEEERDITHSNILSFFHLIELISYASKYFGVYKPNKFFSFDCIFSSLSLSSLH